MQDRTYNIRMSFRHGNAITLDLKGCGTLYIKPGKDYYFINAPINFVNYLAQLTRMGITYSMTNNKKGCYQEIDLSHYNLADPRYVIASLRNTVTIPQTKPTKEEPAASVVLSSDDNIQVADENIVDKVVKSIPKAEETPVVITEDSNIEDTQIVDDSVNDNEPEEQNKVELKVYSEEELTKMSKIKLLEIAEALELNNVSDINTKKEIREAILAAQK